MIKYYIIWTEKTSRGDKLPRRYVQNNLSKNERHVTPVIVSRDFVSR